MTIETKGAVQRKQILENLLGHETMTTIEARARGIMAPAPRVLELRRAGWPIGLHWYDQEDHAGVMHRQGQYYLITQKMTPEQLKIQQQVLADES